MKKLLSLVFAFSLITSNLFGATLEIDYMEYSSDANAQAAYVTNTYLYTKHRYWRIIQTAVISSHAPRSCEYRWKDETGTQRTPNSYTYGGSFYDTDSVGTTAFDGYTNNSDSGWITANTGYVACDFGSSGFCMGSFSAYASYPEYRGASYNIQYSDDNSSWTTIQTWNYTASEYGWHEVTWTPQSTPGGSLQSYSESTIKTQGSYSLKVEAAQTDSLNKTLTKTLSVHSDLTGVDKLRISDYALRTGSNYKIGLHDSGGTTTEYTPNIGTSNTWQTDYIDLSAVSDANKDDIDSIIITVTNADSANTMYLDYFGIYCGGGGGGSYTWVN